MRLAGSFARIATESLLTARCARQEGQDRGRKIFPAADRCGRETALQLTLEFYARQGTEPFPRQPSAGEMSQASSERSERAVKTPSFSTARSPQPGSLDRRDKRGDGRCSRPRTVAAGKQPTSWRWNFMPPCTYPERKDMCSEQGQVHNRHLSPFPLIPFSPINHHAPGGPKMARIPRFTRHDPVKPAFG